MSNGNALLPEAVMVQGRIDPDRVAQVPHRVPIWRCEVDGETVAVGRRFLASWEALEWERGLLDELADRGFPCQRATRIFRGSDAALIDGVWYVARSWLPGEVLASSPEPDLARLGRFMAEFHKAVADLDLGQQPDMAPLPTLLRSPSDEQLLSLLGGQEEVEVYRRLVDEVGPRLANSDSPSMAIHGDFTPSNVVVTAASSSLALIDFGMAHVGSPAVELAYSAVVSTRRSLDVPALELDRVAALVGGYASVRPLPDGVGDALVDFALGRTLLYIAVRAARRGQGVLPTFRLDRAEWLNAHRKELTATVGHASRAT